MNITEQQFTLFFSLELCLRKAECLQLQLEEGTVTHLVYLLHQQQPQTVHKDMKDIDRQIGYNNVRAISAPCLPPTK